MPAAGSLTLLTALLVLPRQPKLHAAYLLGISVLLAMAVFYHQSNVLFSIPLAYYLIASQHRHGLKQAAVVLLAAGAIVLSGYVMAFAFTHRDRTVGDFLQFSIGYLRIPHPSWGTFDHYSVDGVVSLSKATVVNIVHAWESGLKQFVGVFAGVGIIGVLGWSAVQLFRRAPHFAVRGFLVAWLLVYYLYFLWWIPSEREFFIVTLVPLALLTALGLKETVHRLVRSGSRRRIMVGIIGGIAVVVLSASTIHTSVTVHHSRGEHYHAAVDITGITGEECLILHDYHTLQNLRYYFGRDKRFETVAALTRFYYDAAFPLANLENEACILVPWSHLSPAWTATGVDGYDRPMAWLAFVEWLFGFDYDSERNLISSRRFEVVTGSEGGIYVSLSSVRVAVEGIDHLFRTLDELIDGASGQQAGTLRSWLSTVGVGNPQG